MGREILAATASPVLERCITSCNRAVSETRCIPQIRTHGLVPAVARSCFDDCGLCRDGCDQCRTTRSSSWRRRERAEPTMASSGDLGEPWLVDTYHRPDLNAGYAPKKNRSGKLNRGKFQQAPELVLK